MFSRFDTIPECDGHPASHPASHVAVAITLNAQASSLKTKPTRHVIVTTQRNVDVWSFMGNLPINRPYLQQSGSGREQYSISITCSLLVRTAEQMKSFVASMGVEVYTCFEAKSRRRRNEDDAAVNKRKSFPVLVKKIVFCYFGGT